MSRPFPSRRWGLGRSALLGLAIAIACSSDPRESHPDDATGGSHPVAQGGRASGGQGSGGEQAAGDGPIADVGGAGGQSAQGGSTQQGQGGGAVILGEAGGPAGGSAGAGGDSGTLQSTLPLGKCAPVRANPLHAYPARTASSKGASDLVIYKDDIQTAFNTHCGACHVETTTGGFHVDRLTPALIETALSAIRSTDPATSMPPGSQFELFAQRAPTDPIVILAGQLELWRASDPNSDQIRITQTRSGTSAYALSPDLGAALTTLGTCIPARDYPFGKNAAYQKTMRDLDARFAALTPKAEGSLDEQVGLPRVLSETDLTSFDSEQLARTGVIAYAPTYPLWSEDSGKIRFVRVPLGQSIRFRADAQEFEIPPNTRFYKTFLKPVIDANGERRYRKLETRLIVSRPNLASGDPGALFGTYLWNDDETEATLVTDPRRDGTPFKDVVQRYVSDEPKLAKILAQVPAVTSVDWELQRASAVRRYAVPGRERCLQCHIGSVRSDFVLSMTPLQIMRRVAGEGGVLDENAPGADELSQLDRLVALGVITGLGSSDDVTPLEFSQGRSMRNPRELTAQAYLLGNCAHCHNPGGYASLSVPALKDVLNFWPTGVGGIYQFPLERYSPRIFRGIEGRQLPYITSSLRDLLPSDFVNLPNGNPYYTPKWDINGDGEVWDAPWRSLIYRNTQTPFTYADDFAIFPHMPLNTAGHDCTASKLLGEWMLSIPTRRKADASTTEEYQGKLETYDNRSQPYEEVLPSDPGYQAALAAADARVERFQNSQRYLACPESDDCPDPFGADCKAPLYPASPNASVEFSRHQILDPDLQDTGATTVNTTGVPFDKYTPLDGVPDHCHWVETDLTEKPGEYVPRRVDWRDYLVNGSVPTSTTNPQVAAAEADVLRLLKNVSWDSTLTDFVSKPFPMATWPQYQKRVDCDFSGFKRVKDYLAGEPPEWLKTQSNEGGITNDDPVFAELPGGAVYGMICTNCHGPNFDGKGRQAETVALLTGGAAHVPSFRAGLFGPIDSPGTNRAAVFGTAPNTAQPDDWAARYMSWMALGGTRVHIPKPVLQLVSKTDVDGSRRLHPLIRPEDVTANMLAAAQNACGWFVQTAVQARVSMGPSLFGFAVDSTPLIQTNGDAELWQRLCSLNNPPMIHGINVDINGSMRFTSLYDPSDFPSDTPLGNHHGQIEPGLRADNLFPWCIDRTSAGTAPLVGGQAAPMCPKATLLTNLSQDFDAIDSWKRRGAINAGFAVFYYLDQVSKNLVSTVPYNQCRLPSVSQ